MAQAPTPEQVARLAEIRAERDALNRRDVSDPANFALEHARFLIVQLEYAYRLLAASEASSQPRAGAPQPIGDQQIHADELTARLWTIAKITSVSAIGASRAMPVGLLTRTAADAAREIWALRERLSRAIGPDGEQVGVGAANGEASAPSQSAGAQGVSREQIARAVGDAVRRADVFHGDLRTAGYYGPSNDAGPLGDAAEAAVLALFPPSPNAGGTERG